MNSMLKTIEGIKRNARNEVREKNRSIRRDVWIKAWTATASAFDCKEPEVATRWADKALEEFDERIGKGIL